MKILASITFVFWSAILMASEPAASECQDPLAQPWDRQTSVGTLKGEAIFQFAEDMRTILEARRGDNESRSKRLLEYSSPSTKSEFERAFVVFDWAMATILGAQIAGGFAADPSLIVPALLAAPPTLIAADFVSQAFHKWLDSYAKEESRIWGTATREFRKHHEYPGNLNHVDYLSHVAAFGKLFAPVFAVAPFVDMDPVTGTCVWLALVSLFNSTEIHRQAHLKEPGKFFRLLQKAKLTISKKLHMRHHSPPFDSNYSVLNGWSIPLTRKLDLWNRLDRLWYKTFRRFPRNWIQDPRSIPEEVVSDLWQHPENIPEVELAYVLATYPARGTEELRELLRYANEEWKRRFIAIERAHFQDRSRSQRNESNRSNTPHLTNAEWRERVEGEWEIEQFNGWVYGKERIPLFEAN